MTDIRITNWNQNSDQEPKTSLTLCLQVPLNLEDIRTYVHLVDEEESGEGNGIHPAEVSAIDFITLFLNGTYTGNAIVTVDAMNII